MWKKELFADTIREVVVKSKEAGQPITAVELYKELGSMLGYSHETVKYWTKRKSNGPSDPNTIKKLEDYFNVCFFEVDTENDTEKKEETIMNSTYSDFVKNNILFCYEEMRAFLMEMKGCAKEYYHLLYTLEKTKNVINNKRFAIPQETYEVIMEYIDDEFQPFVDDLETILAPVRTPEFEPKYVNGKIQPMPRELIVKSSAIYNEIFFGYFERLDKFAMEKLYPILMS